MRTPSRRHHHPHPSGGRRSQRGSATIWAVLVTAAAFTVLLGLVVDGGRVVDARLEYSRTAAQAARVAADALSQASVRSGRDDVAAGPAIERAHSYLHDVAMTGTVHIAGNTVTVTVTGRSDTEILGVIGIDSFPIRETQTARAITEQDTP
jgi:Flp pilus assembly protein TadG